MFFAGEPISNPPESIRLFSLCQSMKWNFLPNAGGIYDQHPQLIDEFTVLFGLQAEQAETDAKKRDAEMKSKKRGR